MRYIYGVVDIDRTFASATYDLAEAELPGGRGSSRYWYPGAATTGGQDGVLLEVSPIRTEQWLGTFAFGQMGLPLTGVVQLPDRRSFAVISRGALYLAVAEDPQRVIALGACDTRQVVILAGQQVVLFCDHTTITRIDGEGLTWTSRRLAYDDLKITQVVDDLIHVRSYDPSAGADVESTVDLTTGAVRGGGVRFPES